MKNLFAFSILAIAITTFASDTKPEIQGCNVELKTLLKKVSESSIVSKVSETLNYGFDVENRRGSGIRMVKKQDIIKEIYFGQVDLNGNGTVLEVEVSTYSTDLRVKATIKSIFGDKIEVLATGSTKTEILPAFRTIEELSALTAVLWIESSQVASIRESDEAVSNPIDSILFPANTKIYAGAQVSCFADFK